MLSRKFKVLQFGYIGRLSWRRWDVASSRTFPEVAREAEEI
jgi:hypothetical protein